MLRRQLSQGSVYFSVVLNKHIVPNLNHIGQIGIDQFCRVASSNAIKVDFGTRSTGSRGTHFPKIILGAKRQDSGFGQVLQPQLTSFLVGRRLFIAFKIGGVQSFGVEFEFLREALPGHVNGPLFEVITKGPVSQHFKKGVMVHVLSDVVQVIVLASRANAFLCVDGAFQCAHFQIRIASAQKQRLVLIHSGIGKEQRWIVDRYTRTAGPKSVTMLLDKKVNKGLSDLVHGPFQCLAVVCWRCRDGGGDGCG
mmetsp:Transcript_3069/g.8674  ORF Transcript_3069/g.8674 Transcript_3069/m.8674 type:complete len:252 (+) Transcript_3069:2299-3054(+)